MREDNLDFAANADMRHVNGRVAEYFFCGVVRIGEGPREKETLFVRGDRWCGQQLILFWQGVPLLTWST